MIGAGQIDGEALRRGCDLRQAFLAKAASAAAADGQSPTEWTVGLSSLLDRMAGASGAGYSTPATQDGLMLLAWMNENIIMDCAALMSAGLWPAAWCGTDGEPTA